MLEHQIGWKSPFWCEGRGPVRLPMSTTSGGSQGRVPCVQDGAQPTDLLGGPAGYGEMQDAGLRTTWARGRAGHFLVSDTQQLFVDRHGPFGFPGPAEQEPHFLGGSTFGRALPNASTTWPVATCTGLVAGHGRPWRWGLCWPVLLYASRLPPDDREVLEPDGVECAQSIGQRQGHEGACSACSASAGRSVQNRVGGAQGSALGFGVAADGSRLLKSSGGGEVP